MSACNCKTELEAKLTERFKAKMPTAADHNVALQGYGFTIEGRTLTMRPYMQYKAQALHELKKGGIKNKTETGNMAFSFCPFCGVSLEKTTTPVVGDENTEGRA